MQEIRSCWNSLVQFAKLRQFHLSQPPRKPFPSFRRAAYVRKTWNCRISKSCRLYISTSPLLVDLWFGLNECNMASSLATKLCLLLRYGCLLYCVCYKLQGVRKDRLNTCSVHFVRLSFSIQIVRKSLLWPRACLAWIHLWKKAPTTWAARTFRAARDR